LGKGRRIRGIKYGLIALVTLVIAGFIFAPGIAERGMNRTVQTPTQISAAAEELHRNLSIADMHGDTLLWKRSLLSSSAQGHIDLDRLAKGGVALQIFSSVTKTPKGQNYDANSSKSDNITLLAFAQLQPPRTWTSLLERSLYHAEKLREAEAGSDGRLRIVKSRAEVEWLIGERINGKPVIGALLSVEGLHNLEGQETNLKRLYDAGYRMAGLTHFFDNELAGSMHGEKKGGLTPLGRQIVAEMEARGMIVDIAHASHQAVAEILALAKRPVVSSHGGVQATCKVNRNLTDEEIKGVAKTGGVIGIGFWPGAICSTRPEDIARAIAHVRDLVGIDHVGLGSDFDGAITAPFDAGGLAHVTQALLNRGFTESEVRQVMGGNVLRLLIETLPPQ
jgi:membrane dipeptidase